MSIKRFRIRHKVRFVPGWEICHELRIKGISSLTVDPMKNVPLEQRLLDSLLSDWGYIMGSAGLRQALGFSSQAALRVAIATGRVPFQVFPIEGRKGPFALTHDVADWLASRGASPKDQEVPTKRSVRRQIST